jgi:TIR domain
VRATIVTVRQYAGMALSDADRVKLWDLADGRCSICKERVVPPGSSRDGRSRIAIEYLIRGHEPAGEGGLVLPGVYIDSYHNRILLCEDDGAVVRQYPGQFTSAKLAWIKATHEERPEGGVTLTVHQAVFIGSTLPQFFLKVRNWSRDEPIQLNRIWFATDPEVVVDNPDRPLPARLDAGDLFETWIPVRYVARGPDVEFLARLELEGGLVVKSRPNRTMAPAGQIGGGGSPLRSLIRSVAAMNHRDGHLIAKEWDVFISYSSGDRDEVVQPLAAALRECGLRVWYDEFEMGLGDSIRRRIDHGIVKSRFGVVILSPDFFTRRWTNYELDGLVTRSVNGEQVILPIWHNVSQSDVEGYSPWLADKVACDTRTDSIGTIATLITKVVNGATSPVGG